jgi:hypothetical protein
MRGISKTYKHERLRFELSISQAGGIAFALTGGANKHWQPEYDPFDYPGSDTGERYITDDTGAVDNPIPLIRRVLADIYSWVGAEKPYYFSFYSTTERKHRIYKRLASRIAERFGYQLCADGRSFHFYRTVH